MNSDGMVRKVGFIFVIALVIYIAAYMGIEHRRKRLGPWKVTFTRTTAGAPALIINQPLLDISNLQIVFPDTAAANTPTNAVIVFEPPQPVPFDLPFGQCVFMDTTFLPGTVVFKIFDHEIQLMPRVLTLDKHEWAWQSGATFPLTTATTNNAVVH